MQRRVQVAGREGASSNWPLLIVSGIRSRRVDPPMLTPPLWGPVQGGEGHSGTSPATPAYHQYMSHMYVWELCFHLFFFLNSRYWSCFLFAGSPAVGCSVQDGFIRPSWQNKEKPSTYKSWSAFKEVFNGSDFSLGFPHIFLLLLRSFRNWCRERCCFHHGTAVMQNLTSPRW